MLQTPFNTGIFGNSFLRGDQFNPETTKSESPYQFGQLPRMNDPNNPMMQPHVMPRNTGVADNSNTHVLPWIDNMGRIDMSQILGQMPQNPNAMRPMVQPQVQPRMPMQQNPMNRMQPQQMNQQVHSNQNMGKNSKALGSYGGF